MYIYNKIYITLIRNKVRKPFPKTFAHKANHMHEKRIEYFFIVKTYNVNMETIVQTFAYKANSRHRKHIKYIFIVKTYSVIWDHIKMCTWHYMGVQHHNIRDVDSAINH